MLKVTINPQQNVGKLDGLAKRGDSLGGHCNNCTGSPSLNLPCMSFLRVGWVGLGQILSGMRNHESQWRALVLVESLLKAMCMLPILCTFSSGVQESSETHSRSVNP